MQPAEETEVEGVDYGWVMQTTFVVTIVVGAPVAAVLSSLVALETWGARAGFAVRVGAPIWFLTAVVVAAYAKRAARETEGDGNGDAASGEPADASGGPDDVTGGSADGPEDESVEREAGGS